MPLPPGFGDTYEATYKLTLSEGDELQPDDLDAPPDIAGGADLIILRGDIAGEVRSLDGSQTIDVTPAPPAKHVNCPDSNKTPPTTTAADDFVELYRAACPGECRNYRVRIGRSGQVEWDGKEKVAVRGFRTSRLKTEAANQLLDTLQSSELWSECSVPTPTPDQNVDDDGFRRMDYLTVHIAGQTKTVDSSFWNTKSDNGEKLAWTIDKLADTHQWRHGDPVTEPYDNMFDDLRLPKTGMTLLIRSIERSAPHRQFNLEPIKSLLDAGADPNAADESGWTALMYAVRLRRDAVQLLLNAHANVNQASLHGDTALIMDAHRGILNQELLGHDADINHQNTDGVSVLMLLAQYGRFEILQQALAAGADPTAHDASGHNALDYLRAASCRKYLVPLTPEETQASFSPDDPEHPAPCPSTDSMFLQDQLLLEAAIKKASGR